MKRTFARASLKHVMKNHKTGLVLEKNIDLLMFLDYMLFLKRLAENLDTEAVSERQNVILPRSVRKIRKAVLKSARG